MSGTMASLQALYDRLCAFKVAVWGKDSASPDIDADRPVAAWGNADVISSLIKSTNLASMGRHQVVLDIDVPAWLVKSSTPGHHHLYIEVPGGIPWAKYDRLLGELADCGIVEQGYVNASRKRGHTDVRLPWIKKEVTGNGQGGTGDQTGQGNA